MARKRKASTNKLVRKMKKTASKSKKGVGGDASGYTDNVVTPVGKRGKTPIGRRK